MIPINFTGASYQEAMHKATTWLRLYEKYNLILDIVVKDIRAQYTVTIYYREG